MKKKNLRNIIDDDSVDNIEKFRKLSIEANKNVHNDKKRSFTLSPDEDDNEMRVLSYKMPYSLDISTMDSSSNMNHSNGSNNNNNNNCHDNNDENNSNNDWKSSSSVNDNDNNNHDDSNNDNNNHNNNNHDNNNNNNDNNNNNSNNHDNSQVFTSSLNPFRKPDILPIEIFDLLKSQKYFIEGIQYKQLIERTSNSIVQNISNSLFPSFQGNSLLSSIGSNNSLSYSELLHSRQHVQHTQTLEYVKRFSNFDYSEILWGDSEARSKVLALTNIISVNSLGDDLKSVTSTSTSTSAIGNGNGNGIADSGKERGRARSVGKGRKMIRSNSKASTSGTGTGTGPLGTCPNGVSRNRSRTRTSSYDRTDQENRNENDSNELNEQRRRQLSSSFSASKDRGLDSTLDDDGVIIKDFYDNQKLKNSLHRNLSILTTLPSNILKMIDDGVGCVEGVWFTSHPLAPMPLTVIESLLAVTGHKKQGAILSNEKQMTWQLDILRDSDEQKMIRYENYLSTKRNPLIEDQLKNRLQILNKPQSNSSNLQKNTKKVKSVILNDYYRDKGRQANK